MNKRQSVLWIAVMFLALGALVGCGAGPGTATSLLTPGETDAKPAAVSLPTPIGTNEQLPGPVITASANAIANATFWAQGPTHLTALAATSEAKYAPGLAAATLTSEVAQAAQTARRATYVARETKIAETSPSRSNVSRADYQASLALWNAQNIAEYELEVDVWESNIVAGQWRLHVNSAGAKEEVLDYAPLGETKIPTREPVYSDGDPMMNRLFNFTIESMFEDMYSKAFLGDGSPVLGDWKIAFHPMMGYPTSIDYDFPRQGPYQRTWRVLSFKVLK